MESHGVKVLTETKVESFEGSGQVDAVVTNRGKLSTDAVILAIGVRPNDQLAQDADLKIGTTGAIKVDQHTFCKISLRGYEAALILTAAGFERVRVMDGGIAMWPYDKIVA